MPRNGTKNLIPLNKRSKDAQKKIQSQGGNACREANKRRKNLRELASMLLETKVVSEEAKERIKLLFPDVETEDMTNGMAMVARIMMSAITSPELKDAVKAAEFLRDTSGQKPDTNVSGSVSVEKVFISEKEKKETIKHIEKVISGKA